MNILYTCDDDYVRLMGISVISLFENNRDMQDLHVYLLGDGIRDSNKEILRDLEKRYERTITVIDVSDGDIPAVPGPISWPLIVFARLYAGELLPADIRKILYLDCDTVVTDSLCALEGLDTEGKVFLGVKDCIGNRYRKNIGLKPDDLYINAGVILMDLTELRKIPVRERLTGFIVRYGRKMCYADQDVLNGAFHEVTGVLSPRYDVMTVMAAYSYSEILLLRRPADYYSEEDIAGALDDPAIIHYTTNMNIVRPWFSNTDHPLAAEFRHFMSISPWRDQQLPEKKSDSAKARIINLAGLLPRRLSCAVLGWLHSFIRPSLLRIKSEKT